MKLSILAIFLFGLFLLFFKTGTSQISSKAYKVMLDGLYKKTVPLVSVSDAHENLDRAVILDTREPEEFEISHISNAKLVGYTHFKNKSVEHLSKDTLIYVYCSVGYRSERIGEKLLELGFSNVHNLNGGIFEWKNQDQDVLNTEKQITERVHAYSKSWGVWLNKGIKVY